MKRDISAQKNKYEIEMNPKMTSKEKNEGTKIYNIKKRERE